MSTNPGPRSGSRALCASTLSSAALVSFTPLGYLGVPRATTGGVPFHGRVLANGSAAASASSTAPVPGFSRLPPPRSLGVDLLWDGGE